MCTFFFFFFEIKDRDFIEVNRIQVSKDPGDIQGKNKTKQNKIAPAAEDQLQHAEEFGLMNGLIPILQDKFGLS